MQNTDYDFASDMLRGAAQIAQFLFGKSTERRRVYHLIEGGAFPHFKLGDTVCARKSVLLNWVEQQESKPPAQPLRLAGSPRPWSKLEAPKDALSRQELATELGVSYRTIIRFEREKGLPSFVIGKRKRYYRRQDVAEWIKTLGQAGGYLPVIDQ